MKVLFNEGEYTVDTVKKIYNKETKKYTLELRFMDDDEVMEALTDAINELDEGETLPITIQRTSKSSKVYDAVAINYCEEDIFEDIIWVTAILDLA